MRSGFCARDLCTDETRGPTHDRCRKDDCSCRHHDEDVKAKAARLLPPPFAPDPELIDNAEGNKRILAADKAKAQAYLDAIPDEPEPEPRPLWDATAEIAYAALRLSGEAKVISDMTAEEAMRVLYGLRDALDNLRDVEAALVQRIYVTSEHGDVRIDGLPPARVQRGKVRKEWDSRQAAMDYVQHQVVMNDGELPDPLQVAAWVLDVVGVSYCRVTPMRDAGLDVADYCTESPGRISVTFTD